LIVGLIVLVRVRQPTGGHRDVVEAGGISDLAADIRRIDSQLAQLGERQATIDAQAARAVQRVGLMRYNPFEDTGSNQSFALALLDGRSDGVVISSLHSRQQTRIFVKTITAGRSDTPLSDEETEALRRAGLVA